MKQLSKDYHSDAKLILQLNKRIEEVKTEYLKSLEPMAQENVLKNF